MFSFFPLHAILFTYVSLFVVHEKEASVLGHRTLFSDLMSNVDLEMYQLSFHQVDLLFSPRNISTVPELCFGGYVFCPKVITGGPG